MFWCSFKHKDEKWCFAPLSIKNMNSSIFYQEKCLFLDILDIANLKSAPYQRFAENYVAVSDDDKKLFYQTKKFCFIER